MACLDNVKGASQYNPLHEHSVPGRIGRAGTGTGPRVWKQRYRCNVNRIEMVRIWSSQ